MPRSKILKGRRTKSRQSKKVVLKNRRIVRTGRTPPTRAYTRPYRGSELFAPDVISYGGIKDGKNGTWLYWSGERWVSGSPSFLTHLSNNDVEILNGVVYDGRGGGTIYDMFEKHTDWGVSEITIQKGFFKCKANYSGRPVHYVFLTNP